MRLLLAEDERSLAKAVGAILEKNKFSVDIVYDGADALDYLRENWYHSARRCFELFFHDTAYDTRERGPRATTFLITSRHRYCMVVQVILLLRVLS